MQGETVRGKERQRERKRKREVEGRQRVERQSERRE